MNGSPVDPLTAVKVNLNEIGRSVLGQMNVTDAIAFAQAGALAVIADQLTRLADAATAPRLAAPR